MNSPSNLTIPEEEYTVSRIADAMLNKVKALRAVNKVSFAEPFHSGTGEFCCESKREEVPGGSGMVRVS